MLVHDARAGANPKRGFEASTLTDAENGSPFLEGRFSVSLVWPSSSLPRRRGELISSRYQGHSLRLDVDEKHRTERRASLTASALGSFGFMSLRTSNSSGQACPAATSKRRLGARGRSGKQINFC